MIPELITAAVICVTGVMSQYSRGATEAVLHNRSIPGRTAYTLPSNWREYDGFVAVQDCKRLGDTVMIYWRGHSGKFLIYDCSGHASTSAWMTRNNILGEVDYWTARDWHSIGRGMRGAVMCEVKK